MFLFLISITNNFLFKNENSTYISIYTVHKLHDFTLAFECYFDCANTYVNRRALRK